MNIQKMARTDEPVEAVIKNPAANASPSSVPTGRPQEIGADVRSKLIALAQIDQLWVFPDRSYQERVDDGDIDAI